VGATGLHGVQWMEVKIWHAEERRQKGPNRNEAARAAGGGSPPIKLTRFAAKATPTELSQNPLLPASADLLAAPPCTASTAIGAAAAAAAFACIFYQSAAAVRPSILSFVPRLRTLCCAVN
jgi:hypothetical protein